MNNDEPIENKINQALDDSVENLSPEIRRSLNRIRIEATEKKASKNYLLRYASVLGVAFAFIIGLQLMPVTQSDQVDLLAEMPQEELEMLDDLEFVYWMAESDSSEANSSDTL